MRVRKLLVGIVTAAAATLAPCLMLAQQSYESRVVKLYSEKDLEELLDEGAEIVRRRGDIVLCFVPVDESQSIAARVKKRLPDRGSLRKVIVPTLDKAVEFFGAASIQSGDRFQKSFTGKGVVVGICDIGFDPLHPTFIGADGKSRVKRVTQYVEAEGKRIVVEGDDSYAGWITDDADNSHATHVCGILAGGGGLSPFKGVAYDADIVVSTSTLTDVGLLAGVEDIIDYAKEVGKPAVINLSMGGYVGPHDGTSLFSQYLDLCAEDAIIVLSAGNEGKRTNSLRHRFTPESREVTFCLGNTAWNQKEITGVTDVWNSSWRNVKLKLSIFDDETKRIVYSYDPIDLDDFERSEIEWLEGGNEWGLKGSLETCGGVDRENDRYEVALTYDFQSAKMCEGGWARYLIAVTLSGENGDEVEVYADGSTTRLMAVADNTAPDASMSISDLACGQRVVSVGMYGNRAECPVTIVDSSTGELREGSEPTGYDPGKITVHSSYGTLRDGRVMPLTVAPGASLMSAASRPYVAQHPDRHFFQSDGQVWMSLGGTSMSSPYVAGYIATWLEADRSLTSEDVIELIQSSNETDIPDSQDPRNGQGWFNPVKALEKVLGGFTSVDSIDVPEANDGEEIVVVGIDGRVVYRGGVSGMPSLTRGIYVVKSGSRVRKIRV